MLLLIRGVKKNSVHHDSQRILNRDKRFILEKDQIGILSFF